MHAIYQLLNYYPVMKNAHNSKSFSPYLHLKQVGVRGFLGGNVLLDFGFASFCGSGFVWVFFQKLRKKTLLII